MEALAGPYYAAVLLLAAAAVAKLARPGPAVAGLRAAGFPANPAAVRALGAAEIAVAGLAVAAGAVGAATLAATYAAFAVYASHAAGRVAGCGCFGTAGAPLGTLHVTINLALAAVALTVAMAPLPGPGEVLAGHEAGAVPFALLTAATAYLLYVTMTRFAELRGLMRR